MRVAEYVIRCPCCKRLIGFCDEDCYSTIGNYHAEYRICCEGCGYYCEIRIRQEQKHD